MTTYLEKRCPVCLPRVPFVNCRQFMYLVISLFGFEGRIWDLIVSVPDHCLSFYFHSKYIKLKNSKMSNLCFNEVKFIRGCLSTRYDSKSSF